MEPKKRKPNRAADIERFVKLLSETFHYKLLFGAEGQKLRQTQEQLENLYSATKMSNSKKKPAINSQSIFNQSNSNTSSKNEKLIELLEANKEALERLLKNPCFLPKEKCILKLKIGEFERALSKVKKNGELSNTSLIMLDTHAAKTKLSHNEYLPFPDVENIPYNFLVVIDNNNDDNDDKVKVSYLKINYLKGIANPDEKILRNYLENKRIYLNKKQRTLKEICSTMENLQQKDPKQWRWPYKLFYKKRTDIFYLQSYEETKKILEQEKEKTNLKIKVTPNEIARIKNIINIIANANKIDNKGHLIIPQPNN